MAYLTAYDPTPKIDDRAFWAHCQQRELRFQRCTDCGQFRHPPVPCCPQCRSFSHEWVRAGDDARLFSYTIVHHPVFPALRDRVPYNIAIVEFPSSGNVKLVSNVIDAGRGDLVIGMPLELVWEEAGNGQLLPRFIRRNR